MTHVPTLTTDRLILRPHRVADFPAYQALWADPGVQRFIFGAPSDAQACWFRILRHAGSWSLLGFGMWVVEDRQSGVLLGEAGLLNAERGLPELAEVPEAGWVLGPQAWGRGVATEAMAAVLDWADRMLDVHTVRCIIAPNNEGSIKVAEKLGFVPFGNAHVQGAMTRVFDRSRQPHTESATSGEGKAFA